MLETESAIIDELRKANSRLDTIIKQNEKLLNIFLKYDQSYNEEIIKDQGRTDLM